MSSAVWSRLTNFLTITFIIVVANIVGNFLGSIIMFVNSGIDLGSLSYESPPGIFVAFMQAVCGVMICEALSKWWNPILLERTLRAAAWVALAIVVVALPLLILKAVLIDGYNYGVVFGILSIVAGTVPWIVAGSTK